MQILALVCTEFAFFTLPDYKEREYTKYLGVLLDNQLSWGIHISHLTLKLKFVSKNISKSLYFAFIQSHIDYGPILWGTVL